MSKNIDTRQFDLIRAFDKSAAEKKSSDNLLGNQTVRIDRVNWFTGTAEQVQSLDATGVPSATPGEDLPDQTLIALAQDHLKKTAPALGLGDQEPEFVPDPYVKRTGAGTCIVNLQQYYHGIPVFQMERMVVMSQDGAVKYMDGSSVPLPGNLELVPAVALEKAVMAAADYIAAPGEFISPFTERPIPYPKIDLTNYKPRVIASFPSASQPAVVDKDRFSDFIPVHLVFFYQGPQTRLGWHMIISTELGAQYLVIIEADSRAEDPDKPKVLYCVMTSSFMAAIKADVWTHNPGVNKGKRQSVNFPRAIGDYPAVEPAPKLPANFPFPWLDDGADVTEGNCAICVLGRTGLSFKGTLDPTGNLVFTTPAADDQKDDQKLINAFYFCSFMHDFFFLLGFDEVRNFQNRNFTGVGLGGDPVKVSIFDEPVEGLASMSTCADGKQAEMLLGIVGTRHTALDSDVVFHEYTHGVTRRLVGKTLDALSLLMDQSRALGEGWSDYFALSVQNYFLDPERTLLQDWLKGTLEEESMRVFAYDDSFPGTFGMITSLEFSEDHTIGAIWAALLLKIDRRIGAELADRQRGHRIGWRIVFNALPNTPANPSFIQARKAILSSLDDQKGRALSEDEHKRVKRVVWEVFASFGLGQGASSAGASLTNIHEDMTVPPDLLTM